METIENIAGRVWETSLTASWVMLLALPLLLLIRKPAFAPVRYAIALLILARLLFPFSIQTKLSVHNHLPPPRITTSIVYTPPSIATEPERAPLPILPLPWLAGATVLVLRIAVQQWRVRRWIKAGREVTLPALDEARRLIRIRRKITTHVVPQISMPALTGLFRPKLLLPPSALDNPNLRLVFLHELAHIRRWDVLIKWAAIAAQTLHWFNPLVWLVTRRLAADQELLCDAAALRALKSDEQRAYGETLLALASESKPAAAPLLPISGSFKQMKERIGMIKQFKPAPRRTLVLAAVFAAAFSFLAFTRAVDKPQAAAAPPPRTEGKKPQDRINILREEFERLTARIDSHEQDLENMRERFDLPASLKDEDSFPKNEAIVLMEDGMRGFRAERDRAEEILAAIKGKGQEHARKVLPGLHPDHSLSKLLSELSDFEKQFAATVTTHSEKHPEVVRLRSMIKSTDAQVAARIESVKAELEAIAESRQNNLRRAEEQIAKMKARESEMRRNARPYFNLKRDIETMRKVRDTLHARLLQEEIDARISARE